MDAKTYPLQDILKPERRYIIPTFQRDYEWTEDEQWTLLFEDLENVADRLLQVRQTHHGDALLTQKEQALSPHFLGAIVCAALPFSTGGVALRSVIDGQQRLTTMQLLIRGVLDVLTETGSKGTKKVERMLFNPEDVVESEHEIYKVWPRRHDREVWATAMAAAVPPEPTTADHLYLKARFFFAKSTRRYVQDDQHESQEDRLLALVDAMSSLFKLVVIDLDDNDDAQIIFEVLNGRQTPLSATDLVKNLIFLRSELADEDVETLYDRYWAGFDDSWWKEVVGRGHAQRERRDVLLSVWLTIAKSAEANVGHLYRDAREYLRTGPDTEKVLGHLRSVAEAYRMIYEDSDTSDTALRTAYRHIRALDITTAVPLLAWLRTLPAAALPHEHHIACAQAVESWAMRRAFVGWQTRGYGTHLTRVLKEAQEASKNGANIAAAVIGGLSGGVLDWPTDDDLKHAFQTRNFYAMSKARIRLLLGSIDTQKRKDNPKEPGAVVVYDDLQVEHVMPQSWKEHWPFPAGADPTEWTARRSQAVNCIGNLTLVTQSFNGAVSNLAWSSKKPEFEQQRSLMINYDIAASDVWDEDAIGKRAADLAAISERIWPSLEFLLGAVSD
jgi:hypothetical protein